MTEQNNIQLPKSWKILSLSRIIEKIESGKRPKGGVQNISEGIPSIGGEHLDSNGNFKFEKIKYVPVEFAQSMLKGRIQENDILVVKDGATTGKVSFVGKNFPYKTSVINEHVFLLRFRSEILPKYVFYKLWSRKGNQEILKDFRGAAQGGISTNFVNLVEIPLPPLPEQHRIVAKIEELFSELDKAVENLQTARQQLKTYRQSVLKHAFLQPQFKYFQVTLKDISSKIQIGPFGSQLHKSDYISDGIPLINPMHIKDFEIFENYKYSISKEKQESLPNYILRENDIIMGRRGEMGRVALVRKREENWFCGTGSLYIRPNQNQNSAKYLMYYLGSQIVKHFLDKNAAGTTMTNLNKEIVMNIPVLVCPIEEQHQIVAEIEKRFSEADKLEESIETALRQTEALRQSILKKAFEGKLVGPDENKAGE